MDKIDRILTRGVANIIPGIDELRKILHDKRLNVYLGIDPTAPRIHLGHAVPLIKLAKFAELGHNVTLLIGDFTALIGDTSDKESERPVLTPEEIEKNFKTYKKQAEKILDFSKVQVKNNSEWLKKLTFAEIIRLTQQFSFGDFASRELIKKRLSAGKYVGLHEALYPAMQGYDSYYMDTDLQIGGTDQTFNMQAGRTLQKKWRNKDSFILTTEFLSGTDGRKMSKTWNNAIWIDDKPNDMYTKIMSINDDSIIQYFTLVTRVQNEEIENINNRLEKGESPLDIKKELAFEIVKMLDGEKIAKDAQNHFQKTVRDRQLPVNLPIYKYSGETNVKIDDLILLAKLAESKSEAKRLLEQGGVEIDRVKITNPNSEIKVKNDMVIKVGKRKFIKIKIK
ncbi:MAG: tyrosine--tRNA ligase [Candidatus Levybacteria bacterium]|nr:tyrosine--tRNA ligase [Candidatus Levybacteria bacterium]